MIMIVYPKIERAKRSDPSYPIMERAKRCDPPYPIGERAKRSERTVPDRRAPFDRLRATCGSRRSKRAIVSLLLLAPAIALAQGGWLDKPLTNWNKAGVGVPKAPPPQLSAEERAKCAKEFTRPPTTPEDRAVADAGWTLIGPLQIYGGTSAMLAAADYDGMCRPTPVQGFVFSGGKFAGTLSPALVYARSDGALTDVDMMSATTLSARFVRYTPKDPLCCPSRISTAQYEIRGPLVVPLSVETEKP